jgi:hypothetical protein
MAGLRGCLIEGCWRPRYSREWCASHYQRWKRYGDPQAKVVPSDFTAAEWFWRSVDKSGGPDACWPWTGYRMASGYGRNRHGYTHRYALQLALGRPLGPGMEACHTCDNPPCCNPAHLFEGTRLDNERDKTAKGRRNTLPRAA